VPDLFEVFRKWQGRRIHKWHHYFPIYERFLDRHRGCPVVLIEIGLGEGGSLALWRSYLGPQARIIGVDIDPACERFRADGFEIHIGSQSDPEFLLRVIESVPVADIVIDDGGHKASEQITSFETIYPRIAETGLYIVEDTQTSYWDDWKDRADGMTFIEYAKRLCDTLNAWHHKLASFYRFHLPPELRTGTCEVPWFTRHTNCISFFDSVVVFERQTRQEPRHSHSPPLDAT
jgi:hypothetical protein